MADLDDEAGPGSMRGAWFDDRRSIALRLHDDVVQSLSAALMAVGLVRMDHPDDELLSEAETAIDRSAAALRSIIHDLGVEPPSPG